VSAQPGPYRIQNAAELCGVPPATLRAWERRYGVPVPRRTAAAYRLYSADDVELVRRMRELVDGGVSAAEAARTVLAAPAPLADDFNTAADGADLARTRLLSATQRYDAATLDAELTRLAMLLDAQTMYERVLSPLVVEVGRRWEEGVLSVAQEHLLSERVEAVLRASLRALERTEGPVVLLACVEDEAHVIGMLGAALRFAASGARTVVLGAMTPPSAIADAVRSMAPRAVGLSVSVPPEGPARLFKAYAKACGDTAWVVGGPAIDAVADAVTKAGGIAARGPASAWQGQVRDWMRGAR
jgi:MerR family transcriptional regulator, light-induced transcriptional regulator